MVIGKIRPTATIVAQFAAGVEVEAIQHEGRIYLPVVGMGDFAASEDAPKPETHETATSKKPSSGDSSDSTKKYTKDELMDMDVKSLTKILKDEFDVDPSDYEGKNTNKKLRDLILSAQEGSLNDDEEEETEEEDKAPKKSSSKKPSKDDDDEDSDDTADKVAEILEDFDSGKKNKKKTISAICSLVDDADSDKVAELVDKFEDDADADLEEIAEKIAEVLNGDDEEEEEEQPKKSRRGKKKEADDLVDVKDLEVGDRVSVWWDDDNQAWFDGEVKSIKKGKVVIAYDDDTEEPIDPEVHTKIKKLAE